MTAQALMDAVKASVQGHWPGEEVYTNYLPKDFKRPSFSLELQKEETADVNIALVRRTVTLLLTGYVETDDYGNSARAALNQRMEDACGLFAQGYFPVEDRAIQVQTNRGTGAPDFIEVTLIFSWMDGRPACADPDVPPSDVPLMEHYDLNISTKE